MDTSPTCRHSGDGHRTGVAAERGDVALDPLEGRHLILEAVVSWQYVVTGACESQRPQPVIDRYVHEIFAVYKVVRLVTDARAELERAAVDVHDHVHQAAGYQPFLG